MRLPDWKPVSRLGGTIWLSLYAVFLIYALADRSGFLFIDYANLMIHEAGHVLFDWLGYTVMILGGTLAELLAPILCALYFWFRRETAGFAFSAFWLFENFLYIGVYMADARAEALPLVGSGDHDWNILFGQWGLLLQDQRIGGTTRALGWMGMLAIMLWLGMRVFLRGSQPGESPAE